jgi:hypothetical protein
MMSIAVWSAARITTKKLAALDVLGRSTTLVAAVDVVCVGRYFEALRAKLVTNRATKQQNQKFI